MNAEDVYMLLGVIWGVCSVLVWIYGFFFGGDITGPDGVGLLYSVFASILGGFCALVAILILKMALTSL